jgi:hypothetical protein
MFLDVILRSKATKNPIVGVAAEILRGVYPEPVEGLRMTLGSFRTDTVTGMTTIPLLGRSR